MTGLWFVHDFRTVEVETKVRKRLKKEIELWREAEAAAGTPRELALPLRFPAAAAHATLLAREIRAAAGQGSASPLDPVALLESKGARVVTTKLPSGLDSWALWDPECGNVFVFLQGSASPERRRFLAACELATVARFVSEGFRPVFSAAARRTAKSFAAALLMPEEAMREAAHSLALGPKDWSWEIALVAKERFGVSLEAFAHRAVELGLMGPAARRALLLRLKKHYAECREKRAKDFEPHPPAGGTGRLALLRLRAGGQSRFSS